MKIKHLLVCLSLVASVTAGANPAGIFRNACHDEYRPPRAMSPRTSPASGNVTLNIPPNTDQMAFDWIMIANATHTYSVERSHFNGQTTATVDIEPGTYFMVACFDDRSAEMDFLIDMSEARPRKAFCFREDVEVADNTEVSFTWEECVNTIRFETVNPQGEICRFPQMYIVDWETGEMAFDFSNANVVDYTAKQQIYYRCEGMGDMDDMLLFSCMFSGGWTNKNGHSCAGFSDFRTNHVSDRAFFFMERSYSTGNETERTGVFTSISGYKGCNEEDIVIINSPSDYVEFDWSALFNSEYDPAWRKTRGYEIRTAEILNRNRPVDVYFSSLPEFSSDRPIYNLSIDESCTHEPFVFRPITRIHTKDASVSESFTAVLAGRKWNFLNYHNWDSDNASFWLTENYGVPMWPGNTAFDAGVENLDIKLGNTAPLLIVMHQIYSGKNGKVEVHVPLYNGMAGEHYSLGNLSVSIKRDGALIGEGPYSVLEEWESSVNPYDGHQPGMLEISYFKNDVKVDGMDAFNEAYIRYDENLADVNVPTLQKLWIRDSQGHVTNKLDRASDGVMELCGADFNYHSAGVPTWFSCDPVHIKLECSPYGIAEWEELELEEVPENYYAPAYGYFWRVPLGQVTASSETGWYNLRATMTDPSGNMSQQTYGPVFYLGDKKSSIDAVADDSQFDMWLDGKTLHLSEQASVEVYTCDGRMVTDRSEVSSVDLSHLASGIYIVKAHNAAGSLIVKRFKLI